MSSSHTEKLTCPACHHVQDFTIWDFVDVTERPELKTKLLSSTLMRMACGKCGVETDIVYPLMYHDTEYRLLFGLIPGGADAGHLDPRLAEVDPDVASTHQLRLVGSPNELKEKVVLADAGLDDRVVELFKLLLRRDDENQIQEGDGLLFAGLDQEDGESVLIFAILRGTERLAFSAPFEVYARFAEEAESLAESLFTTTSGLWSIVNETTAAKGIEDRGLE